MINYSHQNFIVEARQRSIEWARGLINRDLSTWVILDTETTGLGDSDEVIQIGVIDGAGNVLVDNQLIQPTCAIHSDAQRVHGITREVLKTALTFAEFLPTLKDILKDRLLVIYNADFDTRLLEQSAKANGLPYALSGGTSCAMKQYAAFIGDWNQYHGSFKWQALPAGEHSALGDCRATLALIKQMAEAT